jgi:hypothetical protein
MYGDLHETAFLPALQLCSTKFFRYFLCELDSRVEDRKDI